MTRMAEQSPPTPGLSARDRLDRLEARLDAIKEEIDSLRRLAQERMASTQNTLRGVRRTRKERAQRVDAFTRVVPSAE